MLRSINLRLQRRKLPVQESQLFCRVFQHGDNALGFDNSEFFHLGSRTWIKDEM